MTYGKLLSRTLLIALFAINIRTSEKDKEKPKPEQPVFTQEEQKALNSGGYGSQIGINFALATVMYIGKGFVWACGGIKGAAVAAGGAIKGSAIAGAATAKAGAAAALASPFAPVVAGGIVVTGVGYKAYRYYHPTDKEKAEHAEFEKKQQEDLEKAHFAQCRRSSSQSVDKFRDCLSSHGRSVNITRQGYPKECEEDAYKASLHDERSVDDLTRRFTKYAPKKQG